MKKIVSRELQKLFKASNYGAILHYTERINLRWETDLLTHYMRVCAFIGLHRYDEAMEILDRFKSLQMISDVEMSDEWKRDYKELRCSVLNGLNDFKELLNFASKCAVQYPQSIAFACYELIGAIHQGVVPSSICRVDRLDATIEHFDRAWYFLALYSAHRHLGNDKRAYEIARIAKEKYPGDDGVVNMLSGQEVTMGHILPCSKSVEQLRCRS